MTNDLFEWEKAHRKSDPSTSRDAALSMADGAAGRHHRLIIKAMEEVSRPMAAEQISDMLGIDVWRRFCELERAELIERTEEKHKNRSGRYAFRYVLKRKKSQLL